MTFRDSENSRQPEHALFRLVMAHSAPVHYRGLLSATSLDQRLARGPNTTLTRRPSGSGDPSKQKTPEGLPRAASLRGRNSSFEPALHP
jgi:hypothetical protein